MKEQQQRDGLQAIMPEREIFTKAWEIVKNHRQILSTGTDLEWQILTQEVHNLYELGQTPEQKILAQRVASGLMDYYGEIGKKWAPK